MKVVGTEYSRDFISLFCSFRFYSFTASLLFVYPKKFSNHLQKKVAQRRDEKKKVKEDGQIVSLLVREPGAQKSRG